MQVWKVVRGLLTYLSVFYSPKQHPAHTLPSRRPSTKKKCFDPPVSQYLFLKASKLLEDDEFSH